MLWYCFESTSPALMWRIFPTYWSVWAQMVSWPQGLGTVRISERPDTDNVVGGLVGQWVVIGSFPALSATNDTRPALPAAPRGNDRIVHPLRPRGLRQAAGTSGHRPRAGRRGGRGAVAGPSRRLP